MARGWESKSVESQQADRESVERRVDVSPEEHARRTRLAALELARARVSADLVVARQPAHRAMLEAAMRDLDEQLQALPKEPST